MSYIGPLRDLAMLTGALTPETLPRLVRDLLVSQKHTNIRVTDGPGDGCRDLHSIGRDGEPMLSQCKYHKDTDASVSSKEIGELALGLVKFGYERGLFVTTSRISPQAKREMLSDFPKLTFLFLDGEELLSAVLDDAALTALWFDGDRLALVNSAVSIPVIARRHDGDMPLAVPTAFAPKCVDGVTASVDVRRNVMESASRFAPYRPPGERSLVEGMFADLRCTEILLRGPQSLVDVVESMRRLGQAVVASLSSTETAFAVRLGRPTVTPLSGSSAGSRSVLKVEPLTLVRVDGATTIEKEWLQPTEGSEWDEKSLARSSQAPAVRLYNARIDACAAFELITPPTENGRGIFQERKECERRGWNRSVFALYSAQLDPLTIHPTEPEEILDWIDGRKLASYFHADIQGGYSMLGSTHEQLAQIVETRRNIDAQEDARLKAIRDAHERAGSELVSARLARHMVGVLMSDPLQAYDTVRMRTCDIMWNMDVPSPVDPNARRFRATVCWKLTDPQFDDEDISTINLPGKAQITDAWRDAVGKRGCFLVVHFDEPQDAPRGSSTDARLKRLTTDLELLLPMIEERLGSQGVRATADYWSEKFLIDCRGILPKPDLMNRADWAGPPGCLSDEYMALMEDLNRTRF